MEEIPFDDICKESELLSIVAFNLKGVKWYLEKKIQNSCLLIV